MVHRNYHEIEATGPVDCGRKLGVLFGPTMREYLRVARKSRSWEQLKAEAAALLEATTTHFPQYIEELTAYAAAAGAPLLDVWTITIEDELGDENDERCSTIVTNAGRLIGHNEDWDEDSAEDICILKKVVGGTTSLELYYYGCPLGGVALSINSRGHVQAINSLNHSDWRVGVPKIVIARRMSEIMNVDSELPGLLRIPRSSGFAHTLVDRTGRLTAVECTATHDAVSHPVVPFVHTNHLLAPTLGRFEAQPRTSSTFRRYQVASSLVTARMQAQDMAKLTSNGDYGKSNSVFNKSTIARAIVDFDRSVVSIWLRRESEQGWTDYPIDFLMAGQP